MKDFTKEINYIKAMPNTYCGASNKIKELFAKNLCLEISAELHEEASAMKKLDEMIDTTVSH